MQAERFLCGVLTTLPGLDGRGSPLQSGVVLAAQLHLTTTQGLGFETGGLLVTDISSLLQMRKLQLGVLTG